MLNSNGGGAAVLGRGEKVIWDFLQTQTPNWWFAWRGCEEILMTRKTRLRIYAFLLKVFKVWSLSRKSGYFFLYLKWRWRWRRWNFLISQFDLATKLYGNWKKPTPSSHSSISYPFLHYLDLCNLLKKGRIIRSSDCQGSIDESTSLISYWEYYWVTSLSQEPNFIVSLEPSIFKLQRRWILT